MTDQANPLAQFSDAIAARVEAATTAVVAISLAHERHITGMVCSSDVVVTSLLLRSSRCRATMNSRSLPPAAPHTGAECIGGE